MDTKFTDRPENNTNKSLFTCTRTGDEYILEAKFRALLGNKLFKTLVAISRGGIMRITYEKIEGSRDYRIIVNDRVVGTIEHNSTYKRYPYSVHLEGRGHLVTQSGYDCFATLSITKKEVKEELTGG
jgi:hypothetical protein